jgi:glucose/arabinose dehydrogenase
MKISIVVLNILFIFGSARSQVIDTLAPTPLVIPQQYASLYDSAQTVYLPKGFQCSVFYAKMNWLPRMLAIDPFGRVCVADMENSEIIALPDKDNNGAADTEILLAYNTDNAHSLAFYSGALYTAASTHVLKFEYPNGEGLYLDSSVFIDNIPNVSEGADNHFTRTIAFDTIGKSIFLSVGSPCNACREKNTERAAIWKFNLDGSGKRIYATGLRNAVGLTIDPATDEVWTSVADRNNIGQDIPPESATHLEDGGFYGWPIAYGDHQWVNFQADSEYQAMLPVTANDTVQVNSMKISDIFLDAHSTPLSLAFYYGQKLPSGYNGNLFITLHGSYPSADGRLIGNGTKIVRAQKIGNQWSTSDFAVGFMTDSLKTVRWARPCGIVIDTSGDIYFSSDFAGPHSPPAIFKISYHQPSAVKIAKLGEELMVYPNPAASHVKIKLPDESTSTDLVITDLLGRMMSTIHTEDQKNIDLDVHDFTPGIYTIRTSPGSNQLSTQFMVVH